MRSFSSGLKMGRSYRSQKKDFHSPNQTMTLSHEHQHRAKTTVLYAAAATGCDSPAGGLCHAPYVAKNGHFFPATIIHHDSTFFLIGEHLALLISVLYYS